MRVTEVTALTPRANHLKNANFGRVALSVGLELGVDACSMLFKLHLLCSKKKLMPELLWCIKLIAKHFEII